VRERGREREREREAGTRIDIVRTRGHGKRCYGGVDMGAPGVCAFSQAKPPGHGPLFHISFCISTERAKTLAKGLILRSVPRRCARPKERKMTKRRKKKKN
jgi:hypothetical protein